jgi:predicted transcriptional regulator
MTDAQLEMFVEPVDARGRPAPFVARSSTSRAAAAWADASGLAQTARGKVLRCICEHGPITDEAIADRLGMSQSTQRPRRVELHADGLIEEHGNDGVTRSGRKAVQWVAVW